MRASAFGRPTCQKQFDFVRLCALAFTILFAQATAQPVRKSADTTFRV
jgi:hypothetical protein